MTQKRLRSHVLVAPDGTADFTTIAAALAAHPTGNVEIELVAGTHAHAATLTPSGVVNVAIRGQGRDATVVQCTAGFIDAVSNSDQWTISDLFIQHNAGTNTDNAIRVDYPRRWRTRNCRIEGFGGDSIWYRGGIHSWIEGNIISAVDSTLTNGHAGIHVDRSVALVVPTTVITRNNYIVAGLQYGLLMERGNVGCMSEGDIAEGCAVGMRWDTSSATIIAPYTEANTVGIELFDSAVTIVGRLRDEPAVTWTNVAATDRVITRLDRYFVNPGKGFIFGGSTGGSDPNTSVSERFGTGSPEGVVTAIPGSTFRRTNGAVGTTLYVKESGTGSTGWTALAGASVPGTPTAAAGSANGTTPPAPTVSTGSTDLAGEISFGSGTTPAVGSQVDVTFSVAMAAAPNVTVSSGNSGTPSRQPYVTNRSTTGFSIGFATAASASQAVGTYRVEYNVRP